MTVDYFIALFQQYGLPVMAAVFYLEYLNMPGLPAGVIMPAVGMMIDQSSINLPLAILTSVTAGLAGCLTIYVICFYGGAPLLNKLFGKSKKFDHLLQLSREHLESGRGRGLFVCRLIPVLRTIVSIPAGLLRMPVRDYLLWSAAGIAVWNTGLICFGYFFGQAFLP